MGAAHQYQFKEAPRGLGGVKSLRGSRSQNWSYPSPQEGSEQSLRQRSWLESLPSSHCSPSPMSGKLLPQRGIRQTSLQASPPMLLPSSHSSLNFSLTRPSPHTPPQAVIPIITSPMNQFFIAVALPVSFYGAHEAPDSYWAVHRAKRGTHLLKNLKYLPPPLEPHHLQRHLRFYIRAEESLAPTTNGTIIQHRACVLGFGFAWLFGGCCFRLKRDTTSFFKGEL
jgi:hypothetical protein